MSSKASSVQGQRRSGAAPRSVGEGADADPTGGVSAEPVVVLWSEPRGLGVAHEDGDPFQTAAQAGDASLCVVDALTGRAAHGGAGCSLVSDSDARLGPLLEDPLAAAASDPFFDAGLRPTCYKSEVAPGFAGACPDKLAISDLPMCE